MSDRLALGRSALRWLRRRDRGCAGGCDGSERASPPLVKVKPENGGPQRRGRRLVARFRCPPENGPKLAPVAMTCRCEPSPAPTAEAIGYLRRRGPGGAFGGAGDASASARAAGTPCARSVSCARAPDATIKLDHPVARAHQRRARSRASPCRTSTPSCARSRRTTCASRQGRAVHSTRCGSSATSATGASCARSGTRSTSARTTCRSTSAGSPSGRFPSTRCRWTRASASAATATIAVPWWLEGGRRIPNLSPFKAPPYAVIADRAQAPRRASR